MKYTNENIPKTPFVCYLKHADCNVNDIVKKQCIENNIPIFVDYVSGTDCYSLIDTSHLLTGILKDNVNIESLDFSYDYQDSLINDINRQPHTDCKIYISEIDRIITIDEFMKTL